MIQEYDVTIKHRKGEKMQHIDAISRSPVEEASDTMDELTERMESYVTLTVEDRVYLIQRNDEGLRRIISILEKSEDERTKGERDAVQGYILLEKRLFKRVKVNKQEKELYVVPKTMRKSMAVKYHDCGGHLALEKTLQKLMRTYWWSGMRRYLKQHIAMCMECALVKKPGGRVRGLLNPIPPGTRPFHTMHIDHLGPFVTSKRGNTYLLVVVCNLTKFVKLYPTKTTGVKGVKRALKQLFGEIGVPYRIISDRGTAFTSKKFEEFCLERNIRHTLNSSRHPQATLYVPFYHQL